MSGAEWVDRAEYPFASHVHQVPAGRMHYVDEGSGEPIVMIHGNPAWSFLYRDLVKRLRSDYRCVAPDLIGFGLSDKPPHWSYLPEEHAKNVAALIDDLGLQDVTLVVQDWGGPIGLAYAVSRPDNVARIVLMNTWAWPVNHDPYYVAFSSFVGGPIGRALIRRRNFFAKTIMRQAFGDQTRLTPAIHGHYLRALARPDDRKGCYVFPRQIVGSTPWLGRIWENVHVLDGKPKLCVWGMKDIAFRGKELDRWQRTFPETRIVRLPTVGHFVQEEAPEALGEATASFLRETGTAHSPD